MNYIYDKNIDVNDSNTDINHLLQKNDLNSILEILKILERIGKGHPIDKTIFIWKKMNEKIKTFNEDNEKNMIHSHLCF